MPSPTRALDQEPAPLGVPIGAGELHDGIAAGQIEVHYQPLVHLRTGAASAVEALARWRHPTRGLLPPAAFVPLAEAAGLIDLLGDVVFRAACAALARWQADLRRPDLEVWINVSGRQLLDPAFADRCAVTAAATGLRTASVTIELTESVPVGDCPVAMATLHALRAHGFRLALDDFGSGYSAPGAVDRLPLDALKVDRAHMLCMLEDPGGPGALLRTIVAMARARDLTVIFEGVETPAQHAQLLAHGGEWAQGFLFARPVAADDVVSILLQSEEKVYAYRHGARVDRGDHGAG